MRWFCLLCVLVTVHAKTELELNVEQNVDNCFTETFSVSESSWNSANSQESFVKALQNCLKIKNMLQISDGVLLNISNIAGNLTLEARNINTVSLKFKQFSSNVFYRISYIISDMIKAISATSQSLSDTFVQSMTKTQLSLGESMVEFLNFKSQTMNTARLTLDMMEAKFINFAVTNIPLYSQYLSEYTTKKNNFDIMLAQKNQVQQLILQNVLSHVNARLTRQRFEANCIPGQPWLICTNDFQHIDECYRPARIYHNNQIFAVNSSIEIAEPSFCSSNELCIYTPRGFRCSTTGSEIPNVVYHSSSGFGRAYDVLHRYGMFDISFFTLNKLKRLGVQEMQVEQLGTIDHEGFNQYIFEMYDQLE